MKRKKNRRLPVAEENSALGPCERKTKRVDAMEIRWCRQVSFQWNIFKGGCRRNSALAPRKSRGKTKRVGAMPSSSILVFHWKTLKRKTKSELEAKHWPEKPPHTRGRSKNNRRTWNSNRRSGRSPLTIDRKFERIDQLWTTSPKRR